MTLAESTTGIISDELALQHAQDGGGGGDLSPVIPRPMAEMANSFSASTLTSAASTAAASVEQTLTSAASTVSTTAQNLWAKVSGKAAAPTVQVPTVGAKAASSDSSLLWLWLLLAAGVAYLGYRFTKGKGKGKSFFTPKGSALNLRGRK